MNPALRSLLNQIDTYLSTGNERDSQALWSILAALRGPDGEVRGPDGSDSRMKDATTSVLRAVAFPKTAAESSESGGRVYASMAKDSPHRVFFRARMNPYGGEHFVRHALEAFQALGLKWNEDNTKS